MLELPVISSPVASKDESEVAAKIVLANESLTPSEAVARDHFQKGIDFLERSFLIANNSGAIQKVRDILAKILTAVFAVVGSCKKRGYCCKGFSLFKNGEYIKSNAEFIQACASQPDWSIFIYNGTTDERAQFNCSKLDNQTGLCSIYENRPQVCRDYPHTGLALGRIPDTGCGFTYRPRFFLPIIHNEALLEIIAQMLIGLRRWREASYMYEKSGFKSKGLLLSARGLIEEGCFAEAIPLLEEAERLDGNNCDILEALALCNLKMVESYLVADKGSTISKD